MWYIVNVETWLTVARFPDHEWEQARTELKRLQRKHGYVFKLLDH